VKAAANPKPATDDMLLSRWIGTKTKVANLLSRVWLVVVAGGAILVVLVLGGLWIVRRRSAARAMSGAGS
jgi:hypothetical protein